MNNHELWNELGNLYFISGANDRAVRAYRNAIVLDKDAGEPYTNLAQVYVRMGKYAEAIEFFQQGIGLLTDIGEKAQSLHKLGDTHLHLKEYSHAMKAYQQAQDFIMQFQLAIEVDNKQDLLLDCKPKFARNASSTEVESASKFEEFTTWWFDEQLIPDEDPPDYDLWLDGEVVIGDTNENVFFAEPLKWDLATAYQDSIVATEVQNGIFHDEHVSAESTESNTSITERLETEMVMSITEEKPSHDIQSAKHKRRRASKLETVKVEPEPLSVTMITNEVDAMTKLSDMSAHNMTNIEAVPYEAILELPMAEISFEESARILIEVDRFKRALEINPKNASSWDSLGEQYKALGQYDDAIYAFKKAVSLDPSKVSYRHHLGLVLAAVGRMDDAIASFERVIEIDPDHSLAHAALGGHYRRTGHEELAEVHIEKARGLLANDEDEYNWACMEAICGNADRSLELLEIALKNSRYYVNWASKDPDLKFLRGDSRFPALLTKYATQ